MIAAASRALGIPESDIDVEDGKAIARTGNKPSSTFGELARMAQGMPGFSFARDRRRTGAHRLFHAAAGVLLQRHPRGRARVDPMTGGVAILNYSGPRQRQRHQPDDRRRPGCRAASPTRIGNAMFEFMKYDDDANR